MTTFAAAAEILAEAVSARAFPAACIEAGRAGSAAWTEAFGTLDYQAGSTATRPDTIFDLASLTKVLATATLLMRAVGSGALSLDAPVANFFNRWRGRDREDVTIGDLLEHSSGLTAWLPFYRDHTGRVEFEHAICTLPLEYPPRTRALYSDLGFILLGFLLQDLAARDAAGSPCGLDRQFQRIAADITSEPLTFNPPRSWRPRIAPTEHDAWRGRLLTGEVHDENAWALGGVAGHAGLFGTAAAVGAFARAFLRTLAGEAVLGDPAVAHRFIRRSTIPGSSRALGWDTMRPTSSCGTRLSPTSIGHTGFTGTSLWIDWERDLYVVLLTNRVHPSRENKAIRLVRPRVHDAIVDALA